MFWKNITKKIKDEVTKQLEKQLNGRYSNFVQQDHLQLQLNELIDNSVQQQIKDHVNKLLSGERIVDELVTRINNKQLK